MLINEVHPAPSQGSEWIELYNDSADVVILTDWVLTDLYSSPSVIYTFTQQTIDPHGYIVTELSSAKLNNSADGVTLLNSQNQVIDSMSYDSVAADRSWALINHSYHLSLPTKGTANPTTTPSPTPTPTPLPSSSPLPTPLPLPTPSPSPSAIPDSSWHHHISISAFEPCPNKGEQEWVELSNADDKTHTLTNWKLRDAANNTRIINLTIAAKNNDSISWSNSFLNNNEETIYFENQLGEILQTVTYSNCNRESDDEVKNTTAESQSANSNKASLSAGDPSTFHESPAASITASVVLHSPPPLPSVAYSLKDIALVASSTVDLTPDQPTIFRSPTASPIGFVSVILGGLLLLIAGGWNTYETVTNIRTHRPLS